jgi:hypothetical protein
MSEMLVKGTTLLVLIVSGARKEGKRKQMNIERGNHTSRRHIKEENREKEESFLAFPS